MNDASIQELKTSFNECIKLVTKQNPALANDILTRVVIPTLDKFQKKINAGLQDSVSDLLDQFKKEIETEKLTESAAKIERETKKIIQVKEAALRKLKQAENAKIESEHKRDDLKLEISRIERVVEEQRRNIELERRAKEDLMREKEALAKQTSQAEKHTQKHRDLVSIHEQHKKKAARFYCTAFSQAPLPGSPIKKRVQSATPIIIVTLSFIFTIFFKPVSCS